MMSEKRKPKSSGMAVALDEIREEMRPFWDNFATIVLALKKDGK